MRPQRRAGAAMKSPHLLDLSGIGNPGVLPSRRDSGAARIARRRRKLSGRLRAVHELASDHAGTLDGQTSGVAHVKEIVKYYAQRRGVLTFAPASSTACQDVPRTQGNQLGALPGYGPEIAKNRAEARQLMQGWLRPRQPAQDPGVDPQHLLLPGSCGTADRPIEADLHRCRSRSYGQQLCSAARPAIVTHATDLGT